VKTNKKSERTYRSRSCKTDKAKHVKNLQPVQFKHYKYQIQLITSVSGNTATCLASLVKEHIQATPVHFLLRNTSNEEEHKAKTAPTLQL